MPWKKATQGEHRRRDDAGQNAMTNAEWAMVEPLIPKLGRVGRPRTTCLRRVFDAIQYMLTSGCKRRVFKIDRG